MFRKPEPVYKEKPKKLTVAQRHAQIIAEAKKLTADGVIGQENLAKKLGITANTLLNLEKRYPGQIVYKRQTHQYDWDVLGPRIDELLAMGASKSEVRRQLTLPKRTLASYLSRRASQ